LIPKKVVREMIENLEFVDMTYDPKWEQYVNLELDFFTRIRSAELTPEEDILANKLIQIREEIAKKKKKKEKENEGTFKLFDIDLLSVNPNFKVFYLIVVFAIFIFAVLILLKKLKKKEKSKNKRN